METYVFIDSKLHPMLETFPVSKYMYGAVYIHTNVV